MGDAAVSASVAAVQASQSAKKVYTGNAAELAMSDSVVALVGGIAVAAFLL